MTSKTDRDNALTQFAYDSAERGRSKLLTLERLFSRSWPMPRKLRAQHVGAVYHVMNRGDRREPIFNDEEDRGRFLGTIGKA